MSCDSPSAKRVFLSNCKKDISAVGNYKELCREKKDLRGVPRRPALVGVGGLVCPNIFGGNQPRALEDERNRGGSGVV